MRFIVSLILLGAAVLVQGANAEPYRIVPDPAWVTKIVAPPHTIPSPTASGDVYGVLADIQVHRAIDPPEAFHHYSAQAVNEQGVPDISQITVSFNPAYETLLLHKATIHRQGTAIPVPIRGHVKILHREEGLEQQIYDGALTAVLLIEDVRPGDIVEWSYTLRGANPVLASHYATQWTTTTTAPVGLLHRRLLWPAARAMQVLSRGATVQPTVTRRGDIVEYDLLIHDVPQVDIESGVPDWYDPLRPIVFSNVSSWGDVARWGTTLFQVPTTLEPEMRARIAEFSRKDRGPEERAMAAVQFVQNEIRYLGIEIGENSHRATAPGVVLNRRFGDCKDKALLLVTFLRALGFEAQPALVNTTRRDSVASLGPSAVAFDHVIVRTQSAGKTYWIDPTDTGQRGDMFARMSPPRFGVALVLSEATQGLSRIEPDETLALTTIEKKIEATKVDEPATLTVQTDYYGDEAAATRQRMRARGREEETRSYLAYYRLAYPKIVELHPLRVEDDEEMNHVRVVEQYSIPGFWQNNKGEDREYADVSAFELSNEIPTWQGAHRAMPLRLASPHRTIYTATIDTPDELDSPLEEETIETSALTLTTRKSSSASGISIYHELVRSRDYLTAEERNAAVEDFEKMDLALATEIGEGSLGTGKGRPGVLPWIMALMAATLTFLLMAWMYRAPAPVAIWPHTDYAAGSQPWTPDQPIGGWLYLFGFGILMNPFIALYAAATSLGSASSISGMGLTGANAKFEIVGLIGSVLAAALFVYAAGLVVLFLKRRRIFFRAYLGAVGLSLLAVTFDIVGLQIVSPDDPGLAGQFAVLVRSLISYIIWSVYFVKSRRAEATFVH